MPKDKNLPQNLRLGKTSRHEEAKPPGKGSRGSQIITNLQDINWTPKKLTLTIVSLSLPFLLAVIVSFAVGNYLIASVFIGLGLLVLGMYWLLRYIERSDW